MTNYTTKAQRAADVADMRAVIDLSSIFDALSNSPSHAAMKSALFSLRKGELADAAADSGKAASLYERKP